MFSQVKKTTQRVAQFAALLSFAFTSQQSFANLPDHDATAKALGAKHQWVEIFVHYFNQGAKVFGGIICMVGFLWIGSKALEQYNEMRQGRRDAGSIFGMASVGVGTLIIVSFMLQLSQGVVSVS